MTDEEIVNMIKDIVRETDYDVYKDIFEIPEEPAEENDWIKRLVKACRKHIK